MRNYLLLALCGVAAGTVGGMGMGGGTFLIPLLTVFFALDAHAVVTINLISFIPTATLALIFHIKNGLVRFKGLLPIVLSAFISCVVAYFAAKALPSELLKKTFGGFLICLAAVNLISDIKRNMKAYDKF